MTHQKHFVPKTLSSARSEYVIRQLVDTSSPIQHKICVKRSSKQCTPFNEFLQNLSIKLPFIFPSQRTSSLFVSPTLSYAMHCRHRLSSRHAWHYEGGM